MLRIDGLHAGYGRATVLHGVGFSVEAGEVATIVGRNGSGRSTTLKAIAGVLKSMLGSVRLGDREIAGLRADQIAKLGLAYVPEDREIFPNLTVEENLRIGIQQTRSRGAAWQIDRVWEVFPRLEERRKVKAVSLSGGEQQMLVICRALLGNPKVLLIDEPTEGLAPKIVDQVRDLVVTLRDENIAIVLVEQKLTFALAISDRVYVMGHGRIVFGGTPREFGEQTELRRRWLEV